MTDFAIYECKTCDNYILSTAGEADLRCCGEPPRLVKGDGASYESPEMAPLLRMVFGMNQSEMEICLCVMDKSDATVEDIAEEIELERSVVSRYVNHLTDLGFLKKRTKNLREGGQINVYTHADPEEVTRSLTLGFYRWATDSVELIHELERQKIEHMAAEEPQESSIYWEKKN